MDIKVLYQCEKCKSVFYLYDCQLKGFKCIDCGGGVLSLRRVFL